MGFFHALLLPILFAFSAVTHLCVLKAMEERSEKFSKLFDSLLSLSTVATCHVLTDNSVVEF